MNRDNVYGLHKNYFKSISPLIIHMLLNSLHICFLITQFVLSMDLYIMQLRILYAVNWEIISHEN